jgi:hypothetical protein
VTWAHGCSWPNPVRYDGRRDHRRPFDLRIGFLADKHSGESGPASSIFFKLAYASTKIAAIRYGLCLDLNSAGYCCGDTMNPHQVEKDKEHLEHVISLVSKESRMPLSYWRDKLNSGWGASLVPSHADRLRTLDPQESGPSAQRSSVACALSATPGHALPVHVIESFMQVMPFMFAAELLKPTELRIAELLIETECLKTECIEKGVTVKVAL